MKKQWKKIREFLNNEEEPSTKKTIVFFAFYLVFFAVVFIALFWGGNKDYLKQEYEKGNSSEYKGTIGSNFVYDYKVTYNGVLHDYYGKHYEDVESFKYNNQDYYHEKDQFFVNQDTWIKTENPYLFYEFLDLESLRTVVLNATFMKKDVDEKKNTVFHYLISSNTLNQVLYSENTDYDEEADSIDITTNSSNQITNVSCDFSHYCSHRENCNGTLLVELSFEMFGSVKKIDNPIG